MGILIAIGIALFVAIFAPAVCRRIGRSEDYDPETGKTETHVPRSARTAGTVVRWVAALLAIVMGVGTSFIEVGDNEIALKKRIYLASDLPPGRIIGIGNQKGKKADTIGPGFHFVPLLNVLHDVEKVQMITIPPGHYANLSARDGKPLPPGVTYAPSFQHLLLTYLDAETFLTTEEENIGFKGPQVTILPPGTWRVNTYLWEVSNPKPVTNVPEGTVAVIKSNAVSSVNFGSEMTAGYPTSCAPTETHRGGEALSTPLVPVGCIGIWDTALGQGQYYINRLVFNVTEVPIRVQAWEYEGGFTSRSVALSVDHKGDITQKESEREVRMPETAAASAIDIKIDGYTIHQGARILVQVDPKDAPFIVASVGGLQEVEDRIVTPATQSTLRDLAGTHITVTETVVDDATGQPIINEETGAAKTRTVNRPIAPMDLIENREKLQRLAEEKIRPEGEKAGVTIKEVRFLKPDLPPEVLIPRKRTQLAYAMVQTMEQERKAQQERIAKEQAAATADQQSDLVKAQIAVQKAEQFKEEQRLRGEAERLKLEEIAKGQKAQVAVLGENRVMQLRVIEMALGLVQERPEVLAHLGKIVPDTYVSGSEGGSPLDAFGALLKRGFERSAQADPKVELAPEDVDRLARALRDAK